MIDKNQKKVKEQINESSLIRIIKKTSREIYFIEKQSKG